MPGRTLTDADLDGLALSLSPGQLQQLDGYASLLREWNRNINLVSRRDIDRVASYHIPDSLAAARFLPQSCRAADIGSGGGLPGIPLAIARPDVEFLLIESVRKKAVFLETAIDRLGLARTAVINARAEDVPPLECDVLLSRATGPLKRVIKDSAPHLRRDGQLVIYKSVGPDELPEISSLLARCQLAVVERPGVTLRGAGIVRRFLVLQRG